MNPDPEPKRLGGAAGKVADALAVILVAIAAMLALDLPQYLAWSIYPQQYFAIGLATAMPIAFLVLPAKRGTTRTHVPWFDVVAAVLSFAAATWLAVLYPQLINAIFMRPQSAYIPGLILVILVTEALRRATGWPLVIIIIAFVLYALVGNVLPGRLAARAQDWRGLSAYVALDANGILGLPLAAVSTIVVAFVLFGGVLNTTGGSRFFTDLSLVAMGRLRGAPLKICVVASCLFGMISGSAVADVVAVGVVSIPLMTGAGYPAHRAAGVQSVASTGAQLMPPVMGAAAFIMAEFLQVPYSTVALSALVPGLLYYAALFIQADLEAAKHGMRGLPASQLPPARGLLSGWPFVAAFGVLIVAMFNLNWQPERAALVAACAALVLAAVFGYRGQRPGAEAVLLSVIKSGRSVVDIILIGAGAGIVIGIINLSGLSFNLTYLLVQIGSVSAVLLLLLSAVVCIVLGMGLPTLGVYVLLAALVAPALVQLGISPMAAHLFIFYFGMMSMITPPVAVAAFAGAAIANADPMRTGFAAMRFGWSAFIVPFMFVWSPTLILSGTPLAIAQAIVTAFLGVALVSVAMTGFLFKPLSWPSRLVFASAGILAIVPADAFPGGLYTDVAGVVTGVAAFFYELSASRQATRSIGAA